MSPSFICVSAVIVLVKNQPALYWHTKPQSYGVKLCRCAGAELCRADVDDRASLTTALKGAHYCFAVTDWFAHCDSDREIKQVIQGHVRSNTVCNVYVVQHYWYMMAEVNTA